MRQFLPLLAAATAAACALLPPSAAEAASNERSWSRTGRLGQAWSGASRVDRGPGRIEVERRLSGDRGRGVVQTRETVWGDGASSTSVRRDYANGASSSWSQSRTRNGDGSATRTRSHTGAGGASRSGWTTVYRSDDGFGRSQGFSGSNGRGGTRDTDVIVGDETVTINRQLQTNSGRDHSSSRTFQRR